MKRIIIMALVSILILSSCVKDAYSFIENNNTGSVFLNKINGRVIYINKSNRIADFVDLKLSDEEILRINSQKAEHDAAQKMRDWGEQNIAGTKYKVALKTRYYKDRLLYITTATPYTASIKNDLNSIQINLVDTSGFNLEKITPGAWLRLVDETGKGIALQYSGEIPMTLDNYLEISNWELQWSTY